MNIGSDSVNKYPVRLGWRQLLASAPATNRAQWLEQLLKQYGRHLQLPWYLHSYHVHNEPCAMKHILLDNQNNYDKLLTDYNRARHALGKGLLTNFGPDWQAKRQVIQPFFHRNNIAHLQHETLEYCHTFARRWQTLAKQKKTIELNQEMALLMMGLTGKILFNLDLTPVSDDLVAWLARLNEYVGATALTLPKWVPTPKNREFYNIKAKLREICRTIQQLDQQRQNMQPNIMDYINRCRNYATGGPIDENELYDEILIFLATGHETIALVLTWTFYALSQAPHVKQQLQKTLDNIAWSDLTTSMSKQRDNYCLAIIKESMRLYPPIWNLYRHVINDDNINGYPLKAGSSVMLNIYALHRDSAYWSNAETFQPERFLDETPAHPKWAYIPFGGGKSICIAQNMAVRQMPLILAYLLKTFNVEVLADQAIDFSCAITLRPRYGVLAKISERD